MSINPNDFFEKYEAHVGLSHKRYARRQPIRFSDWNVHSIEHDYSTIQTEQYMEVTIPKHRLQELVERDRFFDELSKRHDYAVELVNQMVRDDIVRKENPAVEKAWRNYQMLLEIARK